MGRAQWSQAGIKWSEELKYSLDGKFEPVVVIRNFLQVAEGFNFLSWSRFQHQDVCVVSDSNFNSRIYDTYNTGYRG